MFIKQLDKRKKRILNILLSSNRVLQKQEIANELNVSSRTVSYDIDYINDCLKDINALIKSKNGLGIWIDIDNSAKQKLFKELEHENEREEMYEKENRCRYIISKLINSHDYISMQELADEIYVSKATINNDIRQVEEWLKRNRLDLDKKTKYGMKILGEEKHIRVALASSIKESNSIHLGFSNNISSKGYSIEINIAKDIEDYITDNEFKAIKDIVNNLYRTDTLQLVDQNYVDITIQLIILLNRIRHEKYINFNKEDMLKISLLPQYYFSFNIINILSEELKITIPESEAAYITLFISSLNSNVELLSTVPFEVGDERDTKVNEIIETLLTHTKERFNIDLISDEQLMLGLRLHLKSAINRMMFGIDFSNTLLEEIKKSYPYSFNITVEWSTILRDIYKIEISENEIGFIALYIQASIERNKINVSNKLKTFIVCGAGIGMAQMLSIQLKKTFEQLEIVKITSGVWVTKELVNLPKEELPELIISNIPIPSFDIPMVKVKPILSMEDISKIQLEIDNILKNKGLNEVKDRFHTLKKYMNDDFIYLDAEFSDDKQLLAEIPKKLVEKGYVKRGFLKSVLERENLSCTYVGNGLAMPHGYVEYVNNTLITFVKLKHPISWSAKKVDIVFLCAIGEAARNDVEKLFEELYDIVNDKELLRKLKQCKSKEEIKKVL